MVANSRHRKALSKPLRKSKLHRDLLAWILGSFVFAFALLLPPSLKAQESGNSAEDAVRTGHFALENPADLNGTQAEDIYQTILADMVEGYAMSDIAAAGVYWNWRRFNTAPYRSAQHGERFVSNYANTIGEVYGKFEDAGTLREGAILAKDSFTVTADGEIYAGALFLMEKMASGFYPESLDWRYSMILPDGSLFGMTKGEGHEEVEFCITCHELAGTEQDHLFFIPEDLRR